MQSFSTVCTSAVNTELCLLMVLLRKTHTCGEPRCIWLRPPARSSSQTSLWPLWRRVKCVSRRSLAMPTPWESVPLRCTPRKESGREYPALQTCVEHNTLLRSTSGEFLRSGSVVFSLWERQHRARGSLQLYGCSVGGAWVIGVWHQSTCLPRILSALILHRKTPGQNSWRADNYLKMNQ